MTEKASSWSEIRAALPAVQAAVQEEIAARIAAGEMIAGVEGDAIIASRSTDIDLRLRRQQLLDDARNEMARKNSDFKSVA